MPAENANPHLGDPGTAHGSGVESPAIGFASRGFGRLTDVYELTMACAYWLQLDNLKTL